MAPVKLIDGRIVKNAQLTDVRHVGDEGSKEATAHIDGKTYSVYNSIVDGFNNVWYEQISFETYQKLGKSGFVEGSLDEQKGPNP